MKSTINKLENAKVELIVELEKTQWKDAQEKAFKKLSKNLTVDGFRKGNVPSAVAKKHISEQNILLEAVESSANAALQAGVSEHSLELIARPDLSIEKLSQEECALKFICTVKPEVELGQYKGLEVKKPRVMVKNEEIEAELTKVAEGQATLEVVERPLQNGDTAVIDFEGFKDDVAFEGGKGENYSLVIGSGTFIPGFEEQLIGLNAGESKDVELSFPENYHVADLAGQPVVFKVTVHEVKEKNVPEINDEIIEELAIEGVKTVEEYKKHVKEAIRAEKQAEVENKYLEDVLEQVKANATFETPDVMVEDELNAMVEDFKNRITSQGLTLELYEQLTGQSVDAMKETMRPDAAKRVGTRLILEAVAEKEALTINEEEYEEEIKKLAQLYSQTEEVIKNAIPKDAMEYEIKLRKALEILKEENKA